MFVQICSINYLKKNNCITFGTHSVCYNIFNYIADNMAVVQRPLFQNAHIYIS